MLTPSVAFSLEAGVVAGSSTLTDVISSSGSAAIRGSVAPCGDGSSVAVGSGSLSAVASDMCSAQRGDGGLGTGSGVCVSPVSTPQRRRNSLEGHPRTTALCTRSLSWHHRTHRAHCPGRW